MIERRLAGLLRRTEGVFLDWRDSPTPGYLVCATNRREVYSQSAGLGVVQLNLEAQ